MKLHFNFLTISFLLFGCSTQTNQNADAVTDSTGLEEKAAPITVDLPPGTTMNHPTLGELVFTINLDSMDRLQVDVWSRKGNLYRLSSHYGNQWFVDHDATTIEIRDINADNLEDLVIRTTCRSGVGPMGAVSYPAYSIYFQSPNDGRFYNSEELESIINDKAIDLAPEAIQTMVTNNAKIVADLLSGAGK